MKHFLIIKRLQLAYSLKQLSVGFVLLFIPSDLVSLTIIKYSGSVSFIKSNNIISVSFVAKKVLMREQFLLYICQCQ
jgi:hypothetical protein